MEFLVILFYGGILALVAPFVIGTSERYGKLVPLAISVVTGSVLWIVFTWIGLPYTDAWIWFLIMLLMPMVVWFATKFLEQQRLKSEESQLQLLRSKQ